MNEIEIEKSHLKRLKRLSEERQRILQLPSEQALEAILDEPQAMALVHSFSEEDFYFLMHDIGVYDALPLISLASEKQWQYILDLEIWEKDRVEISALTHWFNFLLEADENRFLNWFQSSELDLFEYYLFKGLEVRVREHDQHPSEFGKEFYTFEDVYYFRFIDDAERDRTEPEAERELRESLLIQLLRKIAETDHFKFQSILLESASVLTAEMEEELYRLRNVRLTEKGFSPYDEALGIYQPLDPEKLAGSKSKAIQPAASSHEQYLPKPLYAPGMLMAGSLFADALQGILSGAELDQLQMEFAGLCNTIIAADQKKVREKEELKTVVKRAAGYISIGLETLSNATDTALTGNMTHWLKIHALMDLYRVGYGQAVKLKWKADKWRRQSWFSKHQLTLNFWDEDGLGVLGGLLLKRPLFYDNYETGVLYREFNTLADIEKTAAVLNMIIGLDDLFSLLDMAVKPVTDILTTYKNVLLTAWARHQLDLIDPDMPIPLDRFKSFFQLLWENDEVPRKVSLAAKETFLNWLCASTHLADYEINERIGNTLETLFNEIEREFAEVSLKDLDPRYITLFVIEATPSAVKKTK